MDYGEFLEIQERLEDLDDLLTLRKAKVEEGSGATQTLDEILAERHD